ncbi:hypothetical protein THASP1DRAFT_15006 [Thamnocephalis sphaerospora]|uniref:S1 motif domain-containing protein n=1 Tax=Thamnocephalis sphaerospora TaxID=78915 RepID=A0A4P9XTZ4_9FUNG|nr:hypothetical protein THASP1DRAFT_15006 [Thamnocephalis sphaerospora]|eukprot:RKP08900.1 hypothetical protein THASP1DRAFT_15006 [Thamnocephalis sphaerospora]
MSSSAIVTPGQRLGREHQYRTGPGTYVRNSVIHASIVGTREIHSAAEEGELPTISVTRGREQTTLPQVDSIVTGKVLRVNPRFATVAIMAVGPTACRDEFQGIIRVQDVRATEKDKVKIYHCFRPGDVVRAQVISLGDARSYYLSTAQNELGVIFARSVAGVPMIPISWQEMQCTKTKTVELRKCAKPM